VRSIHQPTLLRGAAGTVFLALIALGLLLAGAGPAGAQGACSGSGSLAIALREEGTNTAACTNASPCDIGDRVDYRIRAQNNSEDEMGDPVDAVLGGDTCDMGTCTTSSRTCTTDADCELVVRVLLTSPARPGTFEFDSMVDCTSLADTASVVDRCEPDPLDATGNTVLIFLKGGAANAVAAPNGSFVNLARFTVTAKTPVVNPSTGAFGVAADGVIPGDGAFAAVGTTDDTDCDPQERWNGGGDTSGFFPPRCDVELDKTVAVTSLEDEDDTCDEGTDACRESGGPCTTDADCRVVETAVGWDGEPANYTFQLRNDGNLNLLCDFSDPKVAAIQDDVPVPVGDDPVPLDPAQVACSDMAEGNNTATVTCTCPDLTDSTTGDEDTANLLCLTPALQVTKVCQDDDGNGVDDQVKVTAINAGDADLINCTVSDQLDRGDPDVPCAEPPVGPVDDITLSGIASLPDGAMEERTAAIPAPPLAADACDTATVTCQIDDGTGSAVRDPCISGTCMIGGGTCQTSADCDPKTVSDSEQVVCQGGICEVGIDKQVNCGGGWVDVSIRCNTTTGECLNDPGTSCATDSDCPASDDPDNLSVAGCVGWNGFDSDGDGVDDMGAEPADKRFVVDNRASTTAVECTITDSITGQQPLTVPAGEIGVALVDGVCSDTIEGVDTVSISCECVDTEQLLDSLTDQAEIDCQTPDLGLTKECVPESGGADELRDFVVTASNEGDARLINCVVNDGFAAGTCDQFPPDPATTLGPEPIGPLAPEGETGDSDSVTFQDNAVAETSCNVASVICNLDDGSDNPVPDPAGGFKEITRRAEAQCDVAQGCLTRTPGFWCTHDSVTDLFLPVSSCGLSLSESDAGVANSAIEDLGFSGEDFQDNGTSPQQLQLIRQCAAAALNFAASLDGGGSCEGTVVPGTTDAIEDVFEDCCQDLCNSDASGAAISASGCIEKLDAFNNLEPDTLVCPDAPFPFCPSLGGNGFNATPADCQAATGNGFVNPNRDLGPGQGGGPPGGGPSGPGNGPRKK
jgi:hypothetical protein